MSDVVVKQLEGADFTVSSELQVEGSRRHGGVWKAPEEGWAPNAEKLMKLSDRWIGCHIHSTWAVEETKWRDSAPEYVVSLSPGGTAFVSTGPFRPLGGGS